VDLSTYLWYFHTGEEGIGIGALFSRPPNARVQEIPITLAMLLEFANRGRWEVSYPEHELPARRVDLLVNLGCVIVSFAGLLLIAAAAVFG
jgi:hypothetical protein